MGAIPPYQNKKGFFSSFSDSHLGGSWKAYSLKGGRNMDEYTPHCIDCQLRFDLKVYTTNRSDKLHEALNEKNITHVCMAFATEGIAEIGTFDSIGCEMFIIREGVKC